MTQVDSDVSISLDDEQDGLVASDPFPKGKAGLRPYRAPYYALGIAILAALSPLAYQHIRPLLDQVQTTLDVAVRSTGLGEAEAGGPIVGDPQAKPPTNIRDSEKPSGGTKVAAIPAAVIATPQNEVAQVRQPDNTTTFVVGDRLKLVFFERIESEEDRWRAEKNGEPRAPASYQMRVEFSGETIVDRDGRVTVPILGSFPAARQASQELQASLTKAFEDFAGRRGLVSITIADRPPVYIVGPLKNSGAYKHVPGMTVLHVMALAGGYNVEQPMNWQLVDSAREVDKRDATVERTKRLLAKLAVLVAERDGKAEVDVPADLRKIASDDEARSLISAEQNVRKLAASGFQSRQKAYKAAVELADTDLDSLGRRLRPIDAGIELRTERLKNFDRLSDRGLSSSNQLLQAQAEVMDLQSKRQDAIQAIAQAKQRRALAEQELESNLLAYKTDLQKEISVVELDVPLALKALKASESIISVMRNRQGGRQGEEASSYRILRNSPSGPQFIEAKLTTAVEMGDVVYVAPSTRN
ncbi:MAG: hypothetical protein AB7E81_02860 [Hyphomicrobiaceae bacterium]